MISFYEIGYYSSGPRTKQSLFTISWSDFDWLICSLSLIKFSFSLSHSPCFEKWALEESVSTGRKLSLLGAGEKFWPRSEMGKLFFTFSAPHPSVHRYPNFPWTSSVLPPRQPRLNCMLFSLEWQPWAPQSFPLFAEWSNLDGIWTGKKTFSSKWEQLAIERNGLWNAEGKREKWRQRSIHSQVGGTRHF